MNVSELLPTGKNDVSNALPADWSDSPPSAPALAPPRAVAPRNPGPPPSSSTLTAPQCDCGTPASERTVTKESENKGRRFWTCGNNGGCKFFQWFDGPSNPGTFASTSRAPSASSHIPAKRPFSSIGSGANAGTERRCQCDLTAVLKETSTGANKGKKFWSCPNQSRQAQCKYFEWAVDGEVGAEPPRRSYSNTAGTGRATPSYGAGGGGGGGSKGGDECFQCGQTGHWASGEAAYHSPFVRRLLTRES